MDEDICPTTKEKHKMASGTDEIAAQKGNYWDRYYSALQTGRVPSPSQFAAFVAQEVDQTAGLIIEVGCGNGRDSVFFARSGFDVIGVDGSQAAIKQCSAKFNSHYSNLTFRCATIGTKSFSNVFDELAASHPSSRVVVYARFLLHAITENEENVLLQTVSKYLKREDLFAVEYRTIRDKALTKVTSTHYRRFIDPLSFLMKAKDHHFDVQYSVEGFGFAKYMADDAYVARSVLRKS